MGRAKRKRKVEVVRGSRVDRVVPLDARTVDAILDVVPGHDGADPSVGIGNAVVVGAALWIIIGTVVFLLV